MSSDKTAVKEKQVTVRNTSEEVQAFTGYPPFEPGESRKVSEAEAEVLLRSPFIEEGKGSMKGTEVEGGSVKGVEAEDGKSGK